jgi:hypothetical protein
VKWVLKFGHTEKSKLKLRETFALTALTNKHPQPVGPMCLSGHHLDWIGANGGHYGGVWNPCWARIGILAIPVNQKQQVEIQEEIKQTLVNLGQGLRGRREGLTGSGGGGGDVAQRRHARISDSATKEARLDLNQCLRFFFVRTEPTKKRQGRQSNRAGTAVLAHSITWPHMSFFLH